MTGKTGARRTAPVALRDPSGFEGSARSVVSRQGGLTPDVDATRLLARRVDALVIAFDVRISTRMASAFAEARDVAMRLGSAAPASISGLAFAVRWRRDDIVEFENADLRGRFDERAPGGWTLEVIVRASFLAGHALATALTLCRRVADGIGLVGSARLRRFDLAADFVGFPLSPEDAERVVTRAQTFASFIEDSKDVDEASGATCKPRIKEFRNGRREVTGITAAAGNPLMLRVYDKTAELALPGREAKRALENTLWKEAGWNGEQVTRVEFQLRGRCLDEMGLRDPSILEDRLDAVWQHAVKWFRLVDEGSASRLTRCALDSRWQTVARVVFVHDHASPIRRDRQGRGGATAPHVRGAVLSLLAATGQLEPVVDSSMETFADEVDKRFRLAGSHVRFELLKKYGAKAPAAFAALVAAKCAQFASVDDEAEEEK